MGRIDSILVPIDFSQDSRVALQMADFQARDWHAKLLLLYVDPGIVVVPMRKNPLLKFLRFIKYTPDRRVFSINCVGDPIDTILHVADYFRVRAICMGYGQKGDRPGRVAAGVKSKFKGQVELFSETMAGVLPGSG